MIGILQICIVVVSQNKDTDNDKSTGSDNNFKSYHATNIAEFMKHKIVDSKRK